MLLSTSDTERNTDASILVYEFRLERTGFYSTQSIRNCNYLSLHYNLASLGGLYCIRWGFLQISSAFNLLESRFANTP